MILNLIRFYYHHMELEWELDCKIIHSVLNQRFLNFIFYSVFFQYTFQIRDLLK